MLSITNHTAAWCELRRGEAGLPSLPRLRSTRLDLRPVCASRSFHDGEGKHFTCDIVGPVKPTKLFIRDATPFQTNSPLHPPPQYLTRSVKKHVYILTSDYSTYASRIDVFAEPNISTKPLPLLQGLSPTAKEMTLIFRTPLPYMQWRVFQHRMMSRPKGPLIPGPMSEACRT